MQYKVKKGESLSLIAKNHGIPDWNILYNDPKNQKFRELRPDPNLIEPGDELFVPDKKPGKRKHHAPTGAGHQFVAKVPRGIWNLAWDPEEATYGKVHSVKLSGETNLADGTTVPFHLHDRKSKHPLEFPPLTGVVQGKKVNATWDLKALSSYPDLLDLDLVARADSAVSCNTAALILHDARCIAEEIEVGKKILEKKDEHAQNGEDSEDDKERQPSEDTHTLQLVASASFKLKAGAGSKGVSVGASVDGTDLGKLKSGKKAPEGGDKKADGGDKKADGGDKDGKALEQKTNTDLAKEREKSGGLGHLISKYHTKTSFVLAYARGGEAKTKTKLKLSQKCEKKHTLTLGGAGSGDLKADGDSLKLAWKGSATDPVPAAKPTKYSVEGKGCQGEKRKVNLEVFPSESLLLSVKAELEVGEKEGAPWLSGWAKIMEGLLKLVKLTGAKIEPKLAVEGSIGAFFGWREEQHDWRVYYATELTAELSATIEVEAKFDILKTLTKLPPKLLEYLGEVYAAIKFTGGLKLEGKLEGKTYTPGAGKEDHHDGEVALIGTIGLGVEVGADLGKKNNKIMTASVSGGLECAVHPGGKLEVEDQKISIKPTCSVDAGELKLGVKLKASNRWKWTEWIGEYEKEWKFELWEEHKFKSLEKHEWVIHDGKKE